MLRISTDDRYFQFTAPGKEFPITMASTMTLRGNMILIAHKSADIELYAVAFVKIGYCVAYVRDPQTGNQYLLLGKLGA
jgi:hypothetical protein